jgi:hypothetical protein
MATAGLVAVMDYSKVRDDEFHDWYDTEHLPERQRIPGFLTCERWIGATNPKISIGNYDLASIDVLNTEPYRAISFENASPWAKRVTGMCQRMLRVVSDQVYPGDALAPRDAGGLLLSALNIGPDLEAEFESWADTEHLPALAVVPGTLAARRFRARDGSHRHIFVYHLVAPEVPDSPEWKRAARSPWTEKMLPHFRDRLRVVCRRYVRAMQVSQSNR